MWFSTLGLLISLGCVSGDPKPALASAPVHVDRASARYGELIVVGVFRENRFKRLPLPLRRPVCACGVGSRARRPDRTVLLGLKSGVLSSSDSDDTTVSIAAIVAGDTNSWWSYLRVLVGEPAFGLTPFNT